LLTGEVLMKLIGSKGKGKRVKKADKSAGIKKNKSDVISNSIENEIYNESIAEDISFNENIAEDASFNDPPLNNNPPLNKVSTSKKDAQSKKKENTGKMSTKKKVGLIASCVVGLLIILGTGALAVVRLEIQPFYDYFFRPGPAVLAEQPASRAPVVDRTNPDRPVLEPSVVTEVDEETGEVREVAIPAERDMNKFTFLILGIDDSGGNTDVIMVARFDAHESNLDVVSIPRDTVVNVPWSLRKVNSIHANARNKFRGQNVASEDITAETLGHFRNLLGFNIDFMITISFNAFPRIVDAIGPIDFNVPSSVNVDGVRVGRGNQRLNGRQALAVMRDRGTHSDGDIGRARTQQQFLDTIMKQFLANRSNIKVNDMADIFLRHTNTNIQLNNLVWLGNEFLKMNAENINFFMMPGNFENIRGNFYITLELEPWLELVNEKLSPLTREITEHDVSILTRGPDRLLYVTDDNWLGDRSWGASSRGSTNPQTTTDRDNP